MKSVLVILYLFVISLVQGSPVGTTLNTRADSCKSSASLANVATVKASVAHPQVFCAWYLSDKRVRSPFAGLSVGALESACKCIRVTGNPISFPVDSSTTLAGSPSCPAADLTALKNEFKFPTAFCNFYRSYPRNTSPMTSLTAAKLTNACRCNLGLATSSTVPVKTTTLTTTTTSSAKASSVTKTSVKLSSTTVKTSTTKTTTKASTTTSAAPTTTTATTSAALTTTTTQSTTAISTSTTSSATSDTTTTSTANPTTTTVSTTTTSTTTTTTASTTISTTASTTISTTTSITTTTTSATPTLTPFYVKVVGGDNDGTYLSTRVDTNSPSYGTVITAVDNTPSTIFTLDPGTGTLMSGGLSFIAENNGLNGAIATNPPDRIATPCTIDEYNYLSCMSATQDLIVFDPQGSWVYLASSIYVQYFHNSNVGVKFQVEYS